MPTGARSPCPTFGFGPFALNPEARELRNGATLLHASPRVFDLLLALVENRHRVMRREEILRSLWPRAEVSRAALPQTMLTLRKLLGGVDDSEQWIATVRGVGYRFVGEVRVLDLPPSPPGAAAPRRAAPPDRGSLLDVEAGHRVDVLNQRAQEQAIRLDYPGLRHTVAQLLSREACGADPRARVYALAHQSILDRRDGDSDRCWDTLQRAERLADQLSVPLCRAAVLRAMGQFFLQYVSYGEAIPWFRRAYEIAARERAGFEMADCAFLLAGCLGRAGDAAGCDEWTQTACDLARQTEPHWMWTYVCAALAGTHIHLGERARDADDMPRARRHWQHALRMLDDAEAAGHIADLGGFATVLPVNRAWAEGYLHPEQRTASIEVLQRALAAEQLPQMQLSHLLGLATFLMDQGRLDEARRYGDQGLALGDSTGIFRHRAGFLRLAADIATRQGRLGDAVRHLHTQLRWQDETARADAVRIAKVTALRLKTERALANAEMERNLALQLQRENENLRREAALRDTADPLTQGSGWLSAGVFGAWLRFAALEARERRRTVVLIVVDVARGETLGVPSGAAAAAAAVGGARGAEATALRLAAAVTACLRATDRWTWLASGAVVVALTDADANLAHIVAARLSLELSAVVPSAPGESAGTGFQVLDATVETDTEVALQRLGLTAGPGRAAAQQQG